jgi:hypothetical protein
MPGHVPWQQFVHLPDRMIGDALKDLAKIILGIELIELGGLDQ